jgi:hypothetical protein
VRAIFAFAQFHYQIRDLVAGEIHTMDDMPRWYLPLYLAIKLPLVLWAGAALAIVFALIPRSLPPAERRPMRYELALLAIMAALPVAAQVIGRGPAFSGMRHFTFVVPPLAALAGIGLHLAIEALARWRAALAVALGAVIAAVAAWNASVLIRLHPYEYLAYNPLVGGLAGAYGRYATDYWTNSMPEAVQALEAFVERSERSNGQSPGTYKVSICSEPLQFRHVASGRFQLTDLWEEADFFISSTHLGCDQLLPGPVVATVQRMGVVIAVVKDHRAFKELKPTVGEPAKRTGQ